MAESTEIWYLLGALRIGGTEKTLVDLVNNLDRDRYDVTLFTIIDDLPLRSEMTDHVKFDCLDARGKVDVFTAGSFIRRLRDQRPDILQSFLFFDNNLARVAGVAAPETTIVSGVRAVPNDWGPPRSWIDDLTLPLADHVVSNSNAGAEWVVDRGVDPDDVSVVYNGRNVDRYANATAPDELYAEFDIDSGPMLGTVGRLIERKGHYDLLEAWPAVVDEHPAATLLIVGDGPERDGLERHAERLGCRRSVRFPGFRDDIPELLDVLDIFVFPSHFEGLPGSLIEAMAAGLPIICTPVDGNSELVEGGSSGEFVPPGSPDELATETIALLQDSERRRRMGNRARSRAETRFSVSAMVQGYDDLYRKVLKVR